MYGVTRFAKEVSDINWEHGDNVNKHTYVILVV